MPVTIKMKKSILPIFHAEMARRLAATAIFFVTQHQFRVGIPNPYPHHWSSKPGQYPRKRTGTGQKSVTFQPTDIRQLEKELKVTIGYAAIAPYMAELEIVRRRLGLRKTFMDLLPHLQALVGNPITVTM